MLDEQKLQQLIMGGENSTLELKIAPPRPGELAERLCGLGNAQGGYIVIGVEDATLNIVGVTDVSATIDTILRATRMIQPPLTLDPPDPEVFNLKGKNVVVATVRPSSGPVYQASGSFLIRRGTHTIPLSASELLELANDRGLTSWELQVARKATLEDLDMEKVETFLSYRSTRMRHRARFSNLEEVLAGMDCLTTTANGELRPTNAGILFFGYEPLLHIPHSEVVCVLYQDELGMGRYADRKIITGDIQTLIDQTEAFLNQHIPVGGEIKGWKRVDLPEYPIEALREAVVNAVIHRDYSRVGESIRLFYYSNRIEIHNPGLLLPGITIPQLEQGEAPSKLRNPVLASLLRDVPGYMERIGSGVRFMLHETRQMGLPAPQFKEISEFVVTFYKEVPAATSSSDYDHLVTSGKSNTATSQSLHSTHLPAEAIEEPLSSNAMSRIRQVALIDAERRMAEAMRYVQENGFITSTQYQDLTGLSPRSALRDLEILVERGALKRVGKTRSRHYKLP
jgi:ATP-dependent DNA helicase RecG